MKKTLILVVISISGLILLSQSGVLDALLAFLLVGAVPGTNFSVPSGFMLLLMATILWLVIIKFMPIEIGSLKTKRKKSTKAKRAMPRRRFSEI